MLKIIKKLLNTLQIRNPKIDGNYSRRYSTTRFAMYNSIEKTIKKYKIKGKVLIISEREEYSIRNMFTRGSTFISTEYPNVDIMDLSKFEPESFDVVVSDQVLEHTRNPFKAVSEIRKLLKSKGHIISTSCSFNPIHDDSDYYRFTKLGFREIHRDFNTFLLLESWGNRKVIGKFLISNYKTYDVLKNKNDFRLATENDEEWPWVVWCIAQK